MPALPAVDPAQVVPVPEAAAPTATVVAVAQVVAEAVTDGQASSQC